MRLVVLAGFSRGWRLLMFGTLGARWPTLTRADVLELLIGAAVTRAELTCATVTRWLGAALEDMAPMISWVTVVRCNIMVGGILGIFVGPNGDRARLLHK